MGNACQCLPGASRYSLRKEKQKKEKEEPAFDDIVAESGGVRSGSYRSTSSKYTVSPSGVIHISTELPPEEFIDTRLAYTIVSEKENEEMSRSDSYIVAEDEYGREVEDGNTHRHAKTHVEVMKLPESGEYDNSHYCIEGDDVHLKFGEDDDKQLHHYSETDTLQIPSRQHKRGELNLAFESEETDVTSSQIIASDDDKGTQIFLPDFQVTQETYVGISNDGHEDANSHVHQDSNYPNVFDSTETSSQYSHDSQRLLQNQILIDSLDTTSQSSRSASTREDTHETTSQPVSGRSRTQIVQIGDDHEDDVSGEISFISVGTNSARISMPDDIQLDFNETNGVQSHRVSGDHEGHSSESNRRGSDLTEASNSNKVFQAPSGRLKSDVLYLSSQSGDVMATSATGTIESDGDITEVLRELENLDEYLMTTLCTGLGANMTKDSVYKELSELSHKRDALYDDEYEGREEMYLAEEVTWPIDVIDVPICNENDLTEWYNQEIENLNKTMSGRVTECMGTSDEAVKQVIQEHRETHEKLRKLRLREKLRLEHKLDDLLRKRAASTKKVMEAENEAQLDSVCASLLAITDSRASAAGSDHKQAVLKELSQISHMRDSTFDKYFGAQEEMYFSDEVVWPVDHINIQVLDQHGLEEWYSQEINSLNERTSKRIGGDIDEAAVKHLLDEHKQSQDRLRNTRLRERLRLEGRLTEQLRRRLDAKTQLKEDLDSLDEITSKAIDAKMRDSSEASSYGDAIHNDIEELSSKRDALFEGIFGGQEAMYLSDEVILPEDSVDESFDDAESVIFWYKKELDQLNSRTSRKLSQGKGVDETEVRRILSEHRKSQDRLRAMRLREQMKLENKLRDRLKMRLTVTNNLTGVTNEHDCSITGAVTGERDSSDGEMESDEEEILNQYGDLMKHRGDDDDDDGDVLSLSSQVMSEGFDSDTDSCISQQSFVLRAAHTLKETLKGDIIQQKDMSPEEFAVCMSTFRQELRQSPLRSIGRSEDTDRHKTCGSVDELGGQRSSAEACVGTAVGISEIGVNTEEEAKQETEQLELIRECDREFISTLRSCSNEEDIQRLLKEHIERTEALRKNKAFSLEKHNDAVMLKLRQRRERQQQWSAQNTDNSSLSSAHISDDEDVNPVLMQSRHLDIQFDHEYIALAEKCSKTLEENQVTYEDVEKILTEYRNEQKAVTERRQQERIRIDEKMVEKMEMKRKKKEKLEEQKQSSLKLEAHDVDEAFYSELRARYAAGDVGEREISAMIDQHLEKVKDVERQARRQLRERRQLRQREIDQAEVMSLINQDRLQKQEAQRLRQKERQKTDEKLEEKLRRRKQKFSNENENVPVPPRRGHRQSNTKHRSKTTPPMAYENVEL